LIDDHFHRSPTLANVAHQAADKAQVRIRIDEDLDVHQIAQRLVLENQNSLNDDRRARRKPDSCIGATEIREIVSGPFNGLAFAKPADVLGKQRRVHRVGMIEVLLHPLFKRHARIVFVVVVLLENNDVRFGERFDDSCCNGGLTGAGAAANANDQWTAIEGTDGVLSP
jgi:hypothetical protein